MSKEIRIVIADDHPIFRSGLAQLLKTEERIKIVGEASDGEKALTAIRENSPDIAILDIDMPEKGGFEVAEELSSERIFVEIIFLTMHKNESLFNAALNLGVKGFVLKDSAMEDILNAVRTIIAGESFISQPLTNFLLKRTKFKPQTALVDALTPSEKRVLTLIGEYKTSREIAEKLFISTRTVERHRENICLKLDLHGSKALLRFALENKEKLF
ncbi:MAG: response regulator transcription factor [Pyrinomonadaceae bacterium]